MNIESAPPRASAAAAAPSDPALRTAARRQLARRSRWRPLEIVLLLAALAAVVVLPDRALFLNEIAILALFALSLDLILGYAGIVSLGHAAFFGLGAYAAGLLSVYGVTEPLAGLALGIAAATVLGFATSFLVLRGSDLTRLMITLGVSLILAELANKFASITGGADGLTGVTMGPIAGLFEFDLYGRTAYAYSLAVLVLLYLVARRVVESPFGMSLRAIKGNRLRATAIGIDDDRRLVAIYTMAAAYAGAAGALLAQTTQFVSLEVLEFHRSADVMLVLVLGGAGSLTGGIVGAVLFKVMQDGLSALTPQYWQFWIGLVLVALMLIGRDRFVGLLARPFAPILARLDRATREEDRP